MAPNAEELAALSAGQMLLFASNVVYPPITVAQGYKNNINISFPWKCHRVRNEACLPR